MESILENFGRRWKIGVNLPSFLNSTPKDVARWIGFHFEMQNRIDRIQHRQLGINSTIAKRLEQEIIEQREVMTERTESE